MNKQRRKRLYGTLRGHYHDLMAVFERSSAHKLPGAKGRLREEAVARFLSTWIPKRYTAHTNALAVSSVGDELGTELDVIIHDSYAGIAWPLDADASNSVVTWENIKLVVQVKSVLDINTFNKACEAMQKVTSYSDDAATNIPIRVLFSYKVSPKFADSLLEKFIYSYSDSFPFDVFILLDEGAYFSERLRDLRVGIPRGLGPDLVESDGPSQNELIMKDIIESRIPEGYTLVGDKTVESTLLAFASIATYASAGGEAVQAFLSACLPKKYSPMFYDDFFEEESVPEWDAYAESE